VARANDTEVSAIQRRDLGDSTSLSRGDHGRIDAPERQVVIARDEFGHPHQIGWVDRFEGQIAGGEIT
jgi:hypothetical protein